MIGCECNIHLTGNKPLFKFGWETNCEHCTKFRTVLPSPSEMIANNRWFNHFRLITTLEAIS